MQQLLPVVIKRNTVAAAGWTNVMLDNPFVNGWLSKEKQRVWTKKKELPKTEGTSLWGRTSVVSAGQTSNVSFGNIKNGWLTHIAWSGVVIWCVSWCYIFNSVLCIFCFGLQECIDLELATRIIYVPFCVCVRWCVWMDGWMAWNICIYVHCSVVF